MARRWTVAVLVAGLLAAGGPGSTAVAATEDPGRVAAAGDLGPGELVSATQIAAPGFGDATTWQISYRSTTALGRPNVVGGTVLVPKGDHPGPRPVVGYAVGTHGMGDQCAPSRRIAAGAEGESNIIRMFLDKGLAVAVTDYEGLGTPGDHTYVVGRSEGQALLDVVRAAERLDGLSVESPVAIHGYSQGGQAAGWAAELAGSYAPELLVKGSAVGAPPADLVRVAAFQDGNSGAGLILAAGIGLDAAYPELGLRGYLNPLGMLAVADVRDDCVAELAMKYAFRRLSTFTTVDVLALPAWRARLDEQRLGGVRPADPVLLYHSPSDELLPFDVSTGLRDRWGALGADMTWWATPSGGHVTTLEMMAPAVVGWLANRVTG
ncbi:lipase family protein [Longispora sp. K20-0274]|uniref:lipase family protein n=1 Tax=Longispora sp. K20-0274 TaxID=3088255 RepID=UPI003999E593